MFIAIAGSDGSGKSTVARHFAEQLSRRGHSARLVGRWDIVDNVNYPATRFLKPDIGDLRSCVADMPSLSRLLFLLWTMHMAIEPHLRESAGPVLVADGYWMKHAASEIAYGLPEEYAAAVSAGLPRPDITFLLDGSPTRLYERKIGSLVPYECAMNPDCTREAFINHQNAIRATLQRWAAMYGWITLDPLRSISAVVGDLVGAVEPLLTRK